MAAGDAGGGWRGRGAVRVARQGDRLVRRYAGLTTATGRLKAEIAGFFRKELRALGPGWGTFQVEIWIEQAPGRGAFDVDNVAKACLDGLTGVLCHGDRQVRRLTVEKRSAKTSAIVLVAAQAGDDRAGRDRLAALPAAIG